MISVKQRMDASQALSESLDKKVRVLSRYGDASADAFDETMAYAGIANTLATWWEHMSDEQVGDRLFSLVNSIHAARNNRIVQNTSASAGVNPKEGATIQ